MMYYKFTIYIIQLIKMVVFLYFISNKNNTATYNYLRYKTNQLYLSNCKTFKRLKLQNTTKVINQKKKQLNS